MSPDEPLTKMWWTPRRQDFHVQDEACVIQGLGLFRREDLNQYQLMVKTLNDRALNYINHPKSSEHEKKTVRHGRRVMHSLWIKLSTVPTSFNRAQQLMSVFQRAYLELVGLVDYYKHFKPCINGEQATPEYVQDTIGAFVWDPNDADLLYRAAIPFWMIQPSRNIDQLRIKETSVLLGPQAFLELADFVPPLAPMYSGPPDTSKQYSALVKDIRQTFKVANPFEESSPRVSSQSSTSKRPPASLLIRGKGTSRNGAFYFDLCHSCLR
jgi:hypothetical protein